MIWILKKPFACSSLLKQVMFFFLTLTCSTQVKADACSATGQQALGPFSFNNSGLWGSSGVTGLSSGNLLLPLTGVSMASSSGATILSSGLHLKAKAGSFSNLSVNGFGEQVLAIASADFNLDGAADLLYLSVENGCHLNVILSSQNNNFLLGSFANKITIARCNGLPLAPLLLTGDIDGNGTPDILLLDVNQLAGGAITTAMAYMNNSSASSTLYFTASQSDFSTLLSGAGLGWHASASTPAVLLDSDGDGKVELWFVQTTNTSYGALYQMQLAISSSGAVSTSGFSSLMRMANVHLSGPILGTSPASSTSSKGASILLPVDLNNNGGLDFIVGSVSEKVLHVLKGMQDGSYLFLQDIPLPQSGVLWGDVKDMDQDGLKDLVLITSGNKDGSTADNATVWLAINDGLGHFLTFKPIAALQGPLAFAAVFNADNDAEQAQDILWGRQNSTGNYLLALNQAANGSAGLSGYFAPQATTTSAVFSAASLFGSLASSTGIISVTLKPTISSMQSGGNIFIWVSNNAGQSFEQLSSNEMAGSSHAFSSTGSDFVYRLQFVGGNTSYDNRYGFVASSTPSLSSLGFQLGILKSPVSYSYSKLAVGHYTNSANQQQSALYRASYLYPGYIGQLAAYNLTGNAIASLGSAMLNGLGTSTSSTGSDSGLLWQNTGVSGSSGRTIYTAPLFTTSSNAANSAPSSSGTSLVTLQSVLNTLYSNPCDSRSQRLSAFFSGSSSVSLSLRDPGNSSPLFVGAPQGDANYLKNNYAAFQQKWANRAARLYVGNNDGMLHGFDATAATAASAEFAYVPANLVSNLISQISSSNSSVLSYVHQKYVDGPLVAEDVMDSAGNWHTVLIVGQGQATNGLGDNYYFALDITDPSKILFLWEYSEPRSNNLQHCSVQQNNLIVYSTPTYAPSSSACVTEQSLFDSMFLVTSANTYTGLGGAVEAEIYDAISPASNGANWQIINSALMGQDGSAASAVCYLQVQGATCSSSSSSPCATVRYRFMVNTPATYTPSFRMFVTGSLDNQIAYAIDGTYIATVTANTPTISGWSWNSAIPTSLAAGYHTLTLWNVSPAVKLDKLMLFSSSSNVNTISAQPAVACDLTCNSQASLQLLTSPTTTSWGSCGSAQQCCLSSENESFCAPLGSCPSPNSIMGQALSTPVIGRLQVAGSATGIWAAFFGSGYDNTPGISANVGRSLYALNVLTGQLLGQWHMGDIPFGPSNQSTLVNSLPASPSLVDVDNDGYVDRIYIGDREGRLWKINSHTPMSNTANGALAALYGNCVLFDAALQQGSSVRGFAPIISKPAIAVIDGSNGSFYNHVYFGTGGDDAAPNNLLYRFYAVRDDDDLNTCRSIAKTEKDLLLFNLEWIVGDGYSNTIPPYPLSPSNAEGSIGDKYWADPVILNGTNIYFSSLTGTVHSADACALAQNTTSKLYGYAIVDYRDSAGRLQKAGQSIFAAQPWLSTNGQLLQGPVTSNNSYSNAVVHGSSIGTNNISRSTLFIQTTVAGTSAGSGVQSLSDQGAQLSKRLKRMNWREIKLPPVAVDR